MGSVSHLHTSMGSVSQKILYFWGRCWDFSDDSSSHYEWTERGRVRSVSMPESVLTDESLTKPSSIPSKLIDFQDYFFFQLQLKICISKFMSCKHSRRKSFNKFEGQTDREIDNLPPPSSTASWCILETNSGTPPDLLECSFDNPVKTIQLDYYSQDLPGTPGVNGCRLPNFIV